MLNLRWNELLMLKRREEGCFGAVRRSPIERWVDETCIQLYTPLSRSNLFHFYSRIVKTVNKCENKNRANAIWRTNINAAFCRRLQQSFSTDVSMRMQTCIEGAETEVSFLYRLQRYSIIRRKCTFWSCRRLFKILISIYIQLLYNVHHWLLITRATGHLYAFTTLAASSDCVIDYSHSEPCTTYIFCWIPQSWTKCFVSLMREITIETSVFKPTEINVCTLVHAIIVFSCGPEYIIARQPNGQLLYSCSESVHQ